MAAKAAGESGLAVALVERKQQIADINRSCATMFAIEDDYYFGERMFFSAEQKRLVFPVTGFSMPYDGPYRAFYSWHLYTSDNRHIIKLGDYEANRARGPAGRLSVTYSKQHLLASLLADAKKAGVHVLAGQNVISLQQGKDTSRIKTAEGLELEAPFVIAADGINSRLVQGLGLNRTRAFYGTLQGVSCYMTGLNLPYPEAINYPMLFHKASGYPVMAWIEPSPYNDAEEEFWVYVGGPAHPELNYRAELDRLVSNSPFSAWFPKTAMRRLQAHVANIWEPVAAPVVGSVLIAGDAGWTVEAECTGSMMCGLKAAGAVAEAMRNKKTGPEALASYTAWWNKHFPQSQDYTDFLLLLSSAVIGEDKSLYLNKLVTDTLPCSLNPYKLLKGINAAVMGKIGQIQKERPDIIKAIQAAAGLPLQEQMKGFITTGFPNR
jgi:flavin-dependent dehydrogenase